MDRIIELIGARLKDERRRLGLNQDDFSAVGGVKKPSQIAYEQGKRAPDVLYLIAVAAIGVDMQYVLTGKVSNDALTDDENELLAGYRKLDLRGKAGVLGTIDGLSVPPVPPAGPHVEFHRQVGQQVIGDITGQQTINMGGSKRKSKE